MNAATSNYLEALLQGHESDMTLATGGGLREMRRRAVERANALTVPSVRDEEWRFTDLSPLYKLAFRRAPQAAPVSPQLVEAHAIAGTGSLLVFVDGHFDAGLSRVGNQAGVTVGNLPALGGVGTAVAQKHLGHLASFEQDAFAAVNTAFVADAAIVHVGRDRKVEAPIHLLFIATLEGVASYPRVLVVAEDGAACTVVEEYVGASEGAYFTDAVTEIRVAPNAHVSHVKLQREGKAAFHIANTSASVADHGRFDSRSVALGARISRHNLNVMQAGPATEFHIDGLALIGGRQLADTHSSIDHAHPHGGSRQLHKTVIDGGAHAVFNGRILVRPGAQQTDSGQQSRNLLLSGKAHVDAKPQLEIFADDVKCAHGATVGQIEAEELFYLKSRGLSDASARNLLTYAFAAEVIERIPVKPLVEKLEQYVLEQTQSRQA